MNLLNEIPIIVSTNALEETLEAVKEHKLKAWHMHSIRGKSSSLPYHNRIKKKWIKRWGYIKKPCIFQTSQGYIIHPSLMLKLNFLKGE